MKDPERLAEADASALARRMLHAAREEAPSDAAFERTAAALGVGAVVFGASATASVAAGATGAAAGGANVAAAGAAKVVPSGLLFGAVKWLGIGAVGGLVTAGVAGRVATFDGSSHDVATSAAPRNAPEARTVPAHVPQTLPASTDENPAPEAPGLPEVLEEPGTAVRPRPARSSRMPAAQVAEEASAEASARQARLAAEVEAVDRAREAVARGDTAQALSLVEAYERDFSEQRLRPEALYLRMEALVRRGDHAGARSAARGLLAADPHGPHAARAREVLALTP